ncbi:hypothetical protein PC118_g16206 [Phytophthora cactorum]|uniref:Uncharacterized protein n=1 Tax=Phytophthora cactorum TaxID=29920 RepID=A0A8T1FLN7_9STRA|nr:hypothetical protein PC117_g7822 [Phytophthora cactorum]KAG2971566.1 hypothetical protein PC118_g16206 [Phytophthora cactorum]
MNWCWGIPSAPEEHLMAEEGTNTAASVAERSAVPRTLGKRHAVTSPMGLDEVLGLSGARSYREEENGAANSAGPDSLEEAAAKPNRPRKHRKSTHVVRKEEKERLLKEMAVLNAQLESLKQQAMTSMDVDRVTARSIQVGRELRDDVHVNQQKFGEIASIMSEFSLCNAQAGSPLHDRITLKRDQDSRRKVLREMKASKISKAEHFLRLRRPNTNLRRICDEGLRECPRSSEDDDKMTVVFTRWVQSKLHRPDFPITLKQWNELREKMDLFGKTMQRSLAEDLHIEALGLRMSGN